MDFNKADPPIRRAVTGVSVSLIALILAACSGEANARRLQPPEGWRNAVRDQSQAAADRARQASETLLRRSPAAIAPPLAQGIWFSRRQALREDVRTVPPGIRRKLAPYFDEAVLNSTRWTVAGQDLGVGTLLARWYYEEGAVTLRDVIVFSDAEVARNTWLWAHELAHVEQYRRYGVQGFAQRYAQDWRALEREANSRAFAITADIRTRRAARSKPRAAITRRMEDMLSDETQEQPSAAAGTTGRDDLAPPGEDRPTPKAASAPPP